MPTEEKILVVEDDERVRNALQSLMEAWGYHADVAVDGAQGWEKITSSSPNIVISDLKMPGLSGLDLLKQTREFNPNIYFIVLSGHGTIQHAVEATRLGAFDFLEKPIDPHRLQIVLRNCLDRHESERQLQIAHRKLRDLGALGRLVGRSKEMREVMSVITMVAPSSASVLITGESGTGKEVVARTIHELSSNRKNAFVAVNCAAIPETLIESELFGHEKGAFTGALQARMGCFELAQSGTLLLDEIGDMPITAQAKLLRVLEDSKVRRLGAKSEIQVAVRVLASTNKVPEEAVERGQLRRDLFYRLNVVRLSMPPLRQHLEDLQDLVAAILNDLNRKHNRNVQGVDTAVVDLFRKHDWPGNIRELRNVLERAVVICAGDVITTRELPAPLGTGGKVGGNELALIHPGLSLAEVEKRMILATLTFTNNNKVRAAEILGVTVRTLHNKLKEYAESKSAIAS
jgi:DNA-binding NtrC family response regulator